MFYFYFFLTKAYDLLAERLQTKRSYLRVAQNEMLHMNVFSNPESFAAELKVKRQRVMVLKCEIRHPNIAL